MKILENYSLAHLNTFGFQVSARYFTEVTSVQELREAIHFAGDNGLELIPLGGGSNVVLSGDLDALVIAVQIKGRSVLTRNKNSVVVCGQAGENWHEFVRWTLVKRAYGLENLSLIPGNVGAAPIQNIGAYGVEIKDHFQSLEAVALNTGELKTFTAEECDFAYRDSVFKNTLKDQFIITSVTFRLDAELNPELGYGLLKEEVESRVAGKEITGMAISEAVCDIRQQKLPDPSVLGNAGSFFKNPVVNSEELERLKSEFPDIIVFPFGSQWKLAAGWLIDQAGLKGFRLGRVGTYCKQALVFINHGGAEPTELIKLAGYIQSKVAEKFGVQLEMEPRVY